MGSGFYTTLERRRVIHVQKRFDNMFENNKAFAMFQVFKVNRHAQQVHSLVSSCQFLANLLLCCDSTIKLKPRLSVLQTTTDEAERIPGKTE